MTFGRKGLLQFTETFIINRFYMYSISLIVIHKPTFANGSIYIIALPTIHLYVRVCVLTLRICDVFIIITY